MKHIDISRIDLNLLIAFEAIYQEGSVTGASELALPHVVRA